MSPVKDEMPGQRRASAVHDDAEVDERAFRDTLGHFASGIVVVTGRAPDGEPVGFTCQSFVSLSITPPLVAFCPANSSASWRQLRPAGAFCANVLGGEQERVSDTFARRGTDRFADVAWRPGRTGAPLIDDALAQIECVIEAVHPGGDHDIVLGRVVRLARNPQVAPLLYYQGRYARLARQDIGG